MKLHKSLAVIGLAALLAGSASAKSYKRGVSENKFQYKAQMEVLAPGVSWFYNWSNTIGAYLADQEFLEFVPMCWNGNFSSDNIRNYVLSHPETKYILGFNEPNFTAQANMTPQQAAERWPEIQALAKELNLKIVAPALNYSPNPPYTNPTTWMDEFVALVGSDAFDFVALHNYGGVGVMQSLCTTFHERYGKPVWLTEFCYWPGESGAVPLQSQIDSMVESVEWLEKTDWIYRYAWFKATEASVANYHLLESGKGEEPRSLTEAGMVYVNLSDFDPAVYHEINLAVPAVDYIDRQYASLGKGANINCAKPIEITSFVAGAWLDYQFDVPASDNYTLQLTVSGIGEPQRFNPAISVVSIDADGSEGSVLVDNYKFQLPGSNDVYTTVNLPLQLQAGKQTIRLKDVNPYAPSGLHISTVKLANAAGIADLTTEDAPALVNVYSIQGALICSDADPVTIKAQLTPGLYIIGDKKVIIR